MTISRLSKAITVLKKRGFTEIDADFLRFLADDLEQYTELSEEKIIDDFYNGIDKLTD